MRMPVLAGLASPQYGGQSFAPPIEHAIGNDLPASTGVWYPDPVKPAPGPPSGPGYMPGGNQSGNDAVAGDDPRSQQLTWPVFLPGSNVAGIDAGTANNPNWYRGGISGFNDQRWVPDRHAFWDTGNQKTGLEFHAAAAKPNTFNNPVQEPPRPDLRRVDRSLSWQEGSDNTRNADDLSRPYTRNAQGMWVGEQGSGWSPVYGGTPGLYLPYGSRGGVPYPVQSPVAFGAAGDGPQKVFSGPPHGLHSVTQAARILTLGRYQAAPQMRPVRLDRPSNSPQAGQSYSQTVQMQGAGPRAATRYGAPAAFRAAGRGWRGSA